MAFLPAWLDEIAGLLVFLSGWMGLLSVRLGLLSGWLAQLAGRLPVFDICLAGWLDGRASMLAGWP